MIFRFNHFLSEEVLTSPEPIVKFGEYRKGSGQYGELIKTIMMWLRNYRKDTSNVIKTKLSRFLSETKIKLEELQKLINDLPTTKLLSFSIQIIGDEIIFTNLKNTTKNRFVWENDNKI